MRRLITAMLSLVMLFSFMGCNKRVYEAKAKTFSKDGLTITLTEAFSESKYEGYTLACDSGEVAFFALKESFAEYEGLEYATLEEYAENVCLANADREPGEITEIDGIPTMEYSFYNETSKQTYKYLVAMFKGPDAFWLVHFACKNTEYETYRSHFVEWVKSVSLTAAP